MLKLSMEYKSLYNFQVFFYERNIFYYKFIFEYRSKVYNNQANLPVYSFI